VVLFPNCKINLGLNIVGKRVDGYHDLETIFYPIQIKDAIEIIEEKNPQRSVPEAQISISGLAIDGDIENNLCAKAYNLLKKDFPQLPSAKIHLYKAIPIGAGLGGGSADAAFALKLINKKFDLGLSEKQLMSYALQLGSDCPFFILNEPSFATGRGEILERITLDLSNYKIVFVHSRIHISTAWAFVNIDPCRPSIQIKEVIKEPIQMWKQELKNDFENPVFSKYPEIKKIKDTLYNAGAIYASMSGSGSAVYGILEKEKHINLPFPADYFVKVLNG
jgi:4-diphosphocytidyl-2-C-methyl-D-erythritol kinase